MIFITGTDTNIGKTFVSAVLCKLLNFDYFKPIQTGVGVDMSDSNFISKFDIKTYPETYVFKDPVSPNIASEIEHTEIDLKNIELPKNEGLIIEGAGGILVPVNKNKKIIDLIKQFQIPVLVVSEDKLGTINHTLLTLQALKSQNITVLGFIMNKFKDRNIQGNIKSIEQHSGVECLATIEDNFDISCIATESQPQWATRLKDKLALR